MLIRLKIHDMDWRGKEVQNVYKNEEVIDTSDSD